MADKKTIDDFQSAAQEGVMIETKAAIKTRVVFERAKKLTLNGAIPELKTILANVKNLSRIRKMVNTFYENNSNRIIKDFSEGNFNSKFNIDYNFDFKLDDYLFKTLLNEELGKIGLDFNIKTSESLKNTMLVAVSPSKMIFDNLYKIIPKDMAEFEKNVNEALKINVEKTNPLLKQKIEMLFFFNGDINKPKVKNYSTRALTALKKSFFIDNIGELCKYSEEDLLKVRGIDKKVAEYIQKELANIGAGLRKDEPVIKRSDFRRGGILREL